MAHNAGFALAISVSESGLQQFMHAAFRNGIVPSRYAGKTDIDNVFGTPRLAFNLSYDFFANEPVVILKPNIAELVMARVELYGDMTFRLEGKPTVRCSVYLDLTIAMPVVLVRHKGTKALQFGLEPRQARILEFKVKLTGGTDPLPTYGFSLAQLQGAVLLQLVGLKPTDFLFTSPLLSEIAKFDVEVSAPITKITTNSLNIGIDIPGTTSGTSAELIDLNASSVGGGLTREYETKHVADDEYGEPIYGGVWGPIDGRIGPHGTEFAVSLGRTAFDFLYDNFGRSEVVRRFELDKYEKMARAVQRLQGHHSYTLPEEARVVIRKLEVKPARGYFDVSGTVTYFADTQTTTDFSARAALIYEVNDITFGERWAVHVSHIHFDKPSLPETLAWIFGGILAPFTGGMSLVWALAIDAMLGVILDSLIANAVSSVQLGVTRKGNLPPAAARFTLPETTQPVFNVSLDDFALSTQSLDAWFGLETSNDASASYLECPTTWDASDLQEIVAEFWEGGDLFNRNDPHVRIRWRVWTGNKKQQILDRDLPIHATGNPKPKRISIDHASEALGQVDLFVVQCRIYRPFGSNVREIFSEERRISIVDVLDRHHPYVKWRHRVYYQDFSAKLGDKKRKPLGWVSEDRRSKIHRTDPAKRCRFSTAHTRSKELQDLEYLDKLPFDIHHVKNHRELVCPYCFFGGPDKSVMT